MNGVQRGIRIGLHGAGSAVVDPYGVAHPDGWRGATCGWWLAASDRWHDPRTSPSVRQQRIDGTPVVQTKVAVPGGDVVQRMFVVADHGGRLVMQVSNESPEPVAVAVPTRHLSTTAAAGASHVHGVDTPNGVMAYPLSHRARITFAWPLVLPRFRSAAPIDASQLPSHDQVVRGWMLASDRASRVVPDASSLVAARCELALMTAPEIDAILDTDPILGIMTIAERVRMGDRAQEWTSQLADAVRRSMRSPGRSAWTPRAMVMAARTLSTAVEPTATEDVVRLWQQRGVGTVDPEGGDGSVDSEAGVALRIAAIEHRFVGVATPTSARVLPTGIPVAWRGANVEAHGVVATPDHRLSLALRWHGENAALLWEVDGPPGLHLSAPVVDPGFSSSAAQGEALLRVAP
ncbi:MAG: hypothetical protein ACO3D8_04475 [Ilumatobacteraceae bacterium]